MALAGCGSTPLSDDAGLDAAIPNDESLDGGRDAPVPVDAPPVRTDVNSGGASDADWGRGDCVPFEDDCETDEVCAVFIGEGRYFAGTRCVDAAGALGEGDACAWDRPLEEATRFVTSGCGEGMSCFDGRCRRACRFGCDGTCWEGQCLASSEPCELLDGTCEEGQRCQSHGEERRCLPSSSVGLGGECETSNDCVDGAGCLRGVCTTYCALRECEPFCETSALCDDGSFCHPFSDEDASHGVGAPFGFCATDHLSSCALVTNEGCAEGERCVWAWTTGGTGFATCATETGTLAVGSACTNDVALSAEDRDVLTSRCAEGLGCSRPYRGESVCGVPCELGCDDDSYCPEVGDACVLAPPCVEGACSPDRYCDHAFDARLGRGSQRCHLYALLGEDCHGRPCAAGLTCESERCIPARVPPDAGVVLRDAPSL